MASEAITGFEDLREHLIERDLWISVPYQSVSSEWLDDGERRLDAGYYSARSFQAIRAIAESSVRKRALRDLTKTIFYPPRFKRIWSTEELGIPFVGSTEIVQLVPERRKFLVSQQVEDRGDLFVERGWILLTRSGSVGRLVFANRSLAGLAVSEHVIRIVPNDRALSGYLYAFLSSDAGQALIERSTFGSAVLEIEPSHLEAIQVPLPEPDLQQEIHDGIVQAAALRDECAELLSSAENALYSALKLPIFTDRLVEYLPRPEPKHPTQNLASDLRAFSISSSGLAGRLDASFHVPIARSAVHTLQRGGYPLTSLRDFTSRIYVAPRFRRIYVPEEYGVPLLQGSHVLQSRPRDLKYISRTQTKNIEQWIVEKGWVLMTCSGTIGRVGLVSSFQDGWAASQHILRAIAAPGTSHPGYIAAFLSTAYGQHQVASKIYGAVVDELTEQDAGEILIPKLPLRLQRDIGDPVIRAYELRDQANRIEDDAVDLVHGFLRYQT